MGKQGSGSSSYTQDFYRWTQEQAQYLRSRQFDYLDIENLTEEIASLGRQEKRELVNRLGVLIGHILKWEYQPHMRSKSWRVTIRGQQREIKKLLLENPSLKSFLPEAIADGFAIALDLVMLETSLEAEDLPASCPYTFEQAINYQLRICLLNEHKNKHNTCDRTNLTI